MTHDDPRLAAIYDLDNPDGPDHDFFRARADELAATTIVDLGCGTGLLTVTLARAGRTVIGIDPAAAMLAHARRRPGGDAVDWRLGTSAAIGAARPDLVIMSGNVAMHVLRDAWPTTLRDVSATLGPGGRLIFETRNPAAEAWRGWNHELTTRATPAGSLSESMTTSAPDADGVVRMVLHNEFDGEALDVVQELQFRDLDRLVGDLDEAGLTVEGVWADWSRRPSTGAPDELLFIIEAHA